MTSGDKVTLGLAFGESNVFRISRASAQKLLRVLFELSPNAVLTSIGQRGDELPNANAHASGLSVEVELPLAVRETELIAGARRVLRSGIDGHVGGSRTCIFDHLEGVDA